MGDGGCGRLFRLVNPSSSSCGCFLSGFFPLLSHSSPCYRTPCFCSSASRAGPDKSAASDHVIFGNSLRCVLSQWMVPISKQHPDQAITAYLSFPLKLGREYYPGTLECSSQPLPPCLNLSLLCCARFCCYDSWSRDLASFRQQKNAKHKHRRVSDTTIEAGGGGCSRCLMFGKQCRRPCKSCVTMRIWHPRLER